MTQNLLNLTLHCGSNQATIKEVRAVATPVRTSTWTPIGHDELIDSVISTLGGNGLKVVNEAHALWQGGNRYFGSFQLAGEAPDYALVVGLRNSHDKSFPAGLACGSGVFVCDNLAFSGEVRLSRRHTPRIREDLPRLISVAVGKLSEMKVTQEQRIEAYKHFNLDDFKAHDVLVRSLDVGACPVTRLPAVLKEWREPSHEDFRPRTAWSLFNAFTEVAKANASPERVIGRTMPLHGLFDQLCGVGGCSEKYADAEILVRN